MYFRPPNPIATRIPLGSERLRLNLHHGLAHGLRIACVGYGEEPIQHSIPSVGASMASRARIAQEERLYHGAGLHYGYHPRRDLISDGSIAFDVILSESIGNYGWVFYHGYWVSDSDNDYLVAQTNFDGSKLIVGRFHDGNGIQVDTYDLSGATYPFRIHMLIRWKSDRLVDAYELSTNTGYGSGYGYFGASNQTAEFMLAPSTSGYLRYALVWDRYLADSLVPILIQWARRPFGTASNPLLLRYPDIDWLNTGPPTPQGNFWPIITRMLDQQRS